MIVWQEPPSEPYPKGSGSHIQAQQNCDLESRVSQRREKVRSTRGLCTSPLCAKHTGCGCSYPLHLPPWGLDFLFNALLLISKMSGYQGLIPIKLSTFAVPSSSQSTHFLFHPKSFMVFVSFTVYPDK